MNIPPAMIEMFLRSSGASQSMIELFRMVTAEGFGAFSYTPIPKDDPAWEKIGAAADRSRVGLWVRAESPTSRVSAAIFLEGMKDGTVQTLQQMVKQPVLGATANG